MYKQCIYDIYRRGLPLELWESVIIDHSCMGDEKSKRIINMATGQTSKSTNRSMRDICSTFGVITTACPSA